jgi:tRNA 2-thiouridine synthesizing protein E
MPHIEFENFQIEVDDSGYMTSPKTWTKETAEMIARYDGIGELTEEHWKLLNLIRNHWEEHERAPMIRTLCNETGLTLKDIYKLFPRGPARGACRIAGLPKPEGCV